MIIGYHNFNCSLPLGQVERNQSLGRFINDTELITSRVRSSSRIIETSEEVKIS